jgi:transcriptional regulator with GAF, ATPase, and Fis domain
MCADGRFREDLYFRLHVFPLHIPRLCERGRDVEHLAAAFIQRFARRMGKRIHPLTQEQLKRLRNYDWPGNVRELQNVIERAMILTSGSQLELERAMSGFVAATPSLSVEPALQDGRVLTAREIEALERINIERALKSCAGKVAGETGAARLLGVPATTLSSRMKALGLKRQKA